MDHTLGLTLARPKSWALGGLGKVWSLEGGGNESSLRMLQLMRLPEGGWRFRSSLFQFVAKLTNIFNEFLKVEMIIFQSYIVYKHHRCSISHTTRRNPSHLIPLIAPLCYIQIRYRYFEIATNFSSGTVFCFAMGGEQVTCNDERK